MGKGAKRAKLVKQEKQPNPKSGNEESVSIARQPPSPIPEEAETAFAAQGGAHDERIQNNYWGVDSNAAPAPGGSYSSPHQSRSTSRTGDYKPTSWAAKSDSSSMSLDRPRHPSSPYPKTASVDLDQGDTKLSEEGELDYVSDESSGMDSNSNIQQQWDTATQGRSQARLYPPPQTQQGEPQQPPPNGPSFRIYAPSFSNPPIAPNPLPAPPNVLSKASDAAARINRSKNGDPPPQPPQVLPLPPAAWHSWIKPGVYAPKPEPPAPPQAPPQVSHPQPVPQTAPASITTRSSIHRAARGIWDLKHGKGVPASAQLHRPRGRAHDASGQWSQPRSRSSLDGWPAQPGAGDHNAWNDSGWGPAGESSGWYGNGGSNTAHAKSKSAGAWGGKRNVQWEKEESSSEDTEDDGDGDGWGEHGNDGWGQGSGGQAQGPKPDNTWQGSGGQAQWPKLDNTWQGSGGQAQWPKPDNTWGGWNQDGWNQGGVGLDHQPTSGHSRGEGRKSLYATIAHSAAADNKAVVSPNQKAQILNSLLNMSNQKQVSQTGQGEHRTSRFASKRTQKENRGQTPYNAGWGEESWGNTYEEEDDDDDDDEDEDEDEDEYRPHASIPKRVSNSWDTWGNQEASRYSMPSLTLAHAYKGVETRLDPGAQSKLDDFTRIRFNESRGAALVPVQNAFFGPARPARDRVHWSFSPNKDERVRNAFTWVQEKSYGLGTLGLHKYLQHRERGALFINADFKLPSQPKDFAVDYLTFYDLQKSRDQTLQVSVISYDPATTVVVFVFLPSKTGNSIAIWRRKLFVPNNVRLRFQKELSITLAGLKDPQSYEVYVEYEDQGGKDLPIPRKLDDQTKLKKKRKWWQFFKWLKS